MTTDRPYHRALSLDEAVQQIRGGRGSQFAPRVVDAFFAALAKAPDELAAPEAQALAS
jgi:HD-GYP domain-containing protein (c-di-GMP phosphodiesterase class II)